MIAPQVVLGTIGVDSVESPVLTQKKTKDVHNIYAAGLPHKTAFGLDIL